MTDHTDGDQFQTNVPQERVQDNQNWDTGTPKDPGQGAREDYWEDVSDENAEDEAGAGTGGTSNG
ncbi:hypothetical protein [Deinococcus sp.]|uniref:hypothetical protein n=1 Tax=Deinococcus sp. TaxID=47478 RepID=UPI003C79BF7E